jgi:hypothetical protein
MKFRAKEALTIIHIGLIVAVIVMSAITPSIYDPGILAAFSSPLPFLPRSTPKSVLHQNSPGKRERRKVKGLESGVEFTSPQSSKHF